MNPRANVTLGITVLGTRAAWPAAAALQTHHRSTGASAELEALQILWSVAAMLASTEMVTTAQPAKHVIQTQLEQNVQLGALVIQWSVPARLAIMEMVCHAVPASNVMATDQL